MAIIKAVFLVVSAIIALAAAYPHENELQAKTAAAAVCNEHQTHIAIINRNEFRLKGCTKNGQFCVSGLPTNRCFWTNQCYEYIWYARNYPWTAKICIPSCGRGYCYLPGTLPHCNDVWLQENEEPGTDAALGGVKICDTDANGDEHCRSLDDGKMGKVMEEADCFCVKDDKGHKVCQPDNCDAGRPAP